jgi:phage baseplate assembly protein W
MAAKRALSLEDGNIQQSSIAATRNIDYIDVDLSLDITPVAGDIYKVKGAAAVKQALKILLMTNRGEKPFSPYFGGNIQTYLFELADNYTEREVEFSIINAIKTYEPRVDQKSLIVKAISAPDLNSLEITVIFKIINTTQTLEFTTNVSRLR